MKKIIISNTLKEQLLADNLKGIHIRDVCDIDIYPNGNYITDINIQLEKEQISTIEKALDRWFNALNSDTSWYKNIDDDWINISHIDLGY